MASIVETKAVALRRGTHPENLAFTGVQGEAVIDLGIEDSAGNLGVDSNTTVRIHNGITKGGIPLARADLLNVSTQMLAEERTLVNDKNLAYADLSNLEKVSSESTRNKVVSTLHEYGLAIESDVDGELENKANKNMSNVDTVSLATSAGHSGENLAYANTSNINTADLVNPSYHTGTNGNKPLAYEDTTNVNTANLVDETKHPKDSTNGNKPLAYYDFSNTDTTYLASTTQRPEGMSGPVLAEVDLSNVDPGILYNIISGDVDLNTVERITYKDSTIDENNVIASHYPETRAVVQYISNKTNSSANTELTNVESWNMLYSTSDSQIFTPIVTLVESQNGFEVQEEYGTGIYLTDDPQDHIKAIPTQVDSSGTITELELNGNAGSIDLTSLNPFVITSGTNVDATFTIISTSNGDGTYTYAIGSITNGGTGFEEDEEFFVKSSVSNEYYKVIYQELMIMPTEIEDPISEQQAIGKITKATCYPEHCNTEIAEQVVTITSSTNTIARFTLKTSQFSTTEGAGVAKIDFTNLGGMTATDQVVEQGSNWRIRHDEEIPSLSETTIDSKQDYTIATNGNVWRALKSIQSATDHTPNVIFNTKFIPGTHPTDDTTLFDTEEEGNFVVNAYGKSNFTYKTKYILFPNHQYSLAIRVSNHQYNYNFTTGESGTESTYEFSTALITFNTNIQNAYIRTVDTEGEEKTYHIDETGSCTIVAIRNIDWVIYKQGYSSVSGSISIADGDQTINVTLDEES